MNSLPSKIKINPNMDDRNKNLRKVGLICHIYKTPNNIPIMGILPFIIDDIEDHT